MTTNTDKLAARTFDELTEAERVSAITAFKRAHGSMAELNFAPDRAWIEGFAYAQSLEAAGRMQQAEPVGVVESALSGAGGFHCKLQGNRMPVVGAAIYLAAHPATVQDKLDAERWRWLSSDCDGDLQDDFIQWLAGNVSSPEEINARVDAARASEGAQG